LRSPADAGKAEGGRLLSRAPFDAGLFEGTNRNYAFDEPQDGLGLAGIYGDSTMSSLNRWEQLPSGGSLYYTDNASAVVLANLGIYPIQSPGAQWIHAGRRARVRGQLKVAADFALLAAAVNLGRLAVLGLTGNGGDWTVPAS
jgi:hypothetical protein